MDDNLKGKNLNESKQFVLSCLKDIIDYDYSENDYKIVDMYNLKRYMLRHYSEEEIFKAMNGRQAAEAIEYFKDVEYIDDMTSDKITLDEMLAFYYMAHLYYNKKKIIKILIGYLQD
jgi:hypothetical protein